MAATLTPPPDLRDPAADAEAPLTPPPDLRDPAADPEALIEEARRRTRQRRRRTAAGFVLAVGVATATYATLAGSGSSQPPLATAKAPAATTTTARGLGADIAFSLSRRLHPHGRRISQVYLLHANGSVSQLTRSRYSSSVEAWSPDGSQLVIDRSRWARAGGWVTRLYVMPFDRRRLIALTAGNVKRGGEDDASGAQWSPDGSHIAFTRHSYTAKPGSLRDGVVIVGWNGSRVTGRVWLRGAFLYPGSAAWSPDGTRLVLARATARKSSRGEEIDDSNLHIVSADGTSDATLTQTDRSTCREGPEQKGLICQGYYEPAWSADGTTIIASRSTYLGGDTWRDEIVRVTPTGPHHLASIRVLHTFTNRGRGYFGLGVPSPSQAVYSISSDTGVYTIRSDGTHLRRLRRIVPLGAPGWSANGSRLVFFSLERGHCRLSTVTSDGSQLVQLDPRNQPFPTSCEAARGASGPLWRPHSG